MTTTTQTNKKATTAPAAQSWEKLLAKDPAFEFTLKWTEIAPIYQQVLQTAAKKIKQPGFRPGKVPASLAEDLLDEAYLVRQVLTKLAPAAYKKALAKQKHQPFSEPEIVIKAAEKNHDWQLQAFLPQKPVIKLPDYKEFLQKHKQTAKKKLTAAVKEESKQKAVKTPNEQELNQLTTDKALTALLEQCQPKISLILVRRSAQKEYERLNDNLTKHQLTLQQYLEQTKVSPEELEQQLMLSALRNLQLEFILDALLEKEKITAEPEEIKEKIKNNFSDLSDEQVAAQYQQEVVKNYFAVLVKREKLAQWLTNL